MRNNSNGMRRLCGWVSEGYRYEVLVPTTIFDSQIARIDAYDTNMGSLVNSINFKLRSMPRWDVPAQAIILSRRDEQSLRRKSDELATRVYFLKE